MGFGFGFGFGLGLGLGSGLRLGSGLGLDLGFGAPPMLPTWRKRLSCRASTGGRCSSLSDL